MKAMILSREFSNSLMQKLPKSWKIIKEAKRKKKGQKKEEKDEETDSRVMVE